MPMRYTQSTAGRRDFHDIPARDTIPMVIECVGLWIQYQHPFLINDIKNAGIPRPCDHELTRDRVPPPKIMIEARLIPFAVGRLNPPDGAYAEQYLTQHTTFRREFIIIPEKSSIPAATERLRKWIECHYDVMAKPAPDPAHITNRKEIEEHTVWLEIRLIPVHHGYYDDKHPFQKDKE